MSAGKAVDVPFPSICTLTFGYNFRNPSCHSAIMSFIVSEPTLDRLPATPSTFWYDLRSARLVSCPRAQVAVRIRKHNRDFTMRHLLVFNRLVTETREFWIRILLRT